MLDLSKNKRQQQGYDLLTSPGASRILFDGGARSGKTVLIFEWMVMKALFYPGSKQMILRQTRVQCEHTLWDQTVKDFLNDFMDEEHYKLNAGKLTIEFSNGSTIRFDGCDDEARVRKIFGGEYLTLWCNEASEMDWGTVKLGGTRCAEKNIKDPVYDNEEWIPKEGVTQLIIDTNPRGKRHWLYKAGILNKDPDNDEPFIKEEQFHRIGGWSIYDNLDNLSKGIEKKYEALDDINKRRLLDGEWCSAIGSVYPEFRDDIHICRDCDGAEAPAMCPRIFDEEDSRWKVSRCMRAIDFGYSRDPFVCLWAADVDEQLLFYKCHYKKGVIFSEQAQTIQEMTHPRTPVIWTVADHDAEGNATLRKEGLRTRNAKKDKPIMAGIDRVRKRLRTVNGRPGLMVCQYCHPILDEFSSYMMDKNTDIDMPSKKDDHTMDAMRYMVAEIDGKQHSMAISF